MRTTTYRKLVRDRIPAIIQQNGGLPTVRRLPAAKVLPALKAKLGEEAAELRKAKTRDDLIAEVADVFEILDALLQRSGVSLVDVRRVQREKRRKRGGFAEGFFLVSVRE
jgi:predicted house-cleaning noncanonical NTP pyrophosphatase (MazG superfamily)